MLDELPATCNPLTNFFKKDESDCSHQVGKLNFARVTIENHRNKFRLSEMKGVKELREICLFVRINALAGVFIQYEMLPISTNCEQKLNINSASTYRAP